VNKSVFIDRDGTIAKDVPYCSRPDQFELLPDAGEAIRRLNVVGFKVIMITNQSGIGRGYFTHEMLAQVHDKMKADLVKFGAHIDAIYYCPHHPNDKCDCRKPKPALILKAAKEHDIDLTKSFLVGDNIHDIEAGHAAGCNTVLVSKSGYKKAASEIYYISPDFVADNLEMASRWIVKRN
jgi:D,D-heptose 1,7-bisphosphate phosphatase